MLLGSKPQRSRTPCQIVSCPKNMYNDIEWWNPELTMTACLTCLTMTLAPMVLCQDEFKTTHMQTDSERRQLYRTQWSPHSRTLTPGLLDALSLSASIEQTTKNAAQSSRVISGYQGTPAWMSTRWHSKKHFPTDHRRLCWVDGAAEHVAEILQMRQDRNGTYR